MPGLFDYFRQLGVSAGQYITGQRPQTITPPRQPYARPSGAPTTVPPSYTKPTPASTVSPSEIQARYGERYVGYEDLITIRPGGGYDTRAADAARAADLRKQEIQSLSGYGLLRYQFQQAGAERTRALQQANYPRYQAVAEREWQLGVQLERGWISGAIPPSGPLPPRISPGISRSVLSSVMPSAGIRAGPNLYVVGIGERAIEMARLPETVSITESPFLGIFGGGTKTIPTKEYLEKYEPAGVGTLISPGSAGVRLKGQYAGPVEQFGRWWGASEAAYSGVIEAAGLPRDFWTKTAERASTLPPGIKQLITVGAGVGEKWTSHPLETVGSLALGAAITEFGPSLSAAVRMAPAGSLLARVASVAGPSLRIGGAALVTTWGAFTAVDIAKSERPLFRAGEAAGQIIPWIAPAYIKNLPAFTGWITRSPTAQLPAWRLFSAEEMKRPRTQLRLETIKTLDVREVIDLRRVIDVTGLEPREILERPVNLKLAYTPKVRTVDTILEAMTTKIEVPVGKVDIFSGITLPSVAELDLEYGIISQTPVVSVIPESIVKAGVFSIVSPVVATLAGTRAITESIVGSVAASMVGEKAAARTETVSRTLLIPRITSITTPITESRIFPIPRITFPPSTVTITGIGIPRITIPKIPKTPGETGKPWQPYTPPIIPKLGVTFPSFGGGGGRRRRPLGAFGYRKWQAVLSPRKALSFKVKGLSLSFAGPSRRSKSKDPFAINLKGMKKVRI